MIASERFVAVILTACLLCTVAGLGTVRAADKDIPAHVAAVAKANNAFALDMFDRLRNKEGNLFFSPYSIETALAMTMAGARGQTAAQMQDVLHLSAQEAPAIDSLEKLAGGFGSLQAMLRADKKTDGYVLQVANALFPQKNKPFLKDYVNLVTDKFDAGYTPLDFAADAEGSRKIVNTWVEDHTAKKIENLLPKGSVEADTRLVLTNAVYFKGDWAFPFDEKTTRESMFRLAPDKTVKAPMMTRKARYGYAHAQDISLVEMPYEGDKLSMVLLVPDDRTGAGLGKVEKGLTREKLDVWIKQLDTQEVVLSMPKFKFTFGTEKLNDELQALGMKTPFTDAADFSGMDGTRYLFIGGVYHKAFIEVNEKGSEAAAATAVVLELKEAAVRRPKVVQANRPFLFLIRHKTTGAILFMGRVADPTK